MKEAIKEMKGQLTWMVIEIISTLVSPILQQFINHVHIGSIILGSGKKLFADQ